MTMYMQKQSIQVSLENALLHNVMWSDELYNEVLTDFVEQMKESLHGDADDAIICLVAEQDQAAMMLVEVDNNVLRNEAARHRLKQLWKESYKINVTKVIPILVEHLSQGMLGVAGIKVTRDA
jgi:hypothetical protein